MAATLESLVRRDQALIAAALGVMAGLGWIHMVLMPHWNAAVYSLAALMWATMMVAMMLPAAAPMVLAFAHVRRARMQAAHPAAPTAIFLGGYLAVWLAFAMVMAAAQWALHESALLSEAMGKSDALLAAALLATAGAFQWTNIKQACLAKCRTPLGFIATEWREGPRGAFVMGLRHGVFCTGCCWALMLLMFAGGVMNLLWMLALAAYMLAEKVLPGGRVLARTTGALMVAAGAGLALWAIGTAP
jgi:predicted metal-binding membrane protein